jgi:parallel beta-helix repeat protein
MLVNETRSAVRRSMVRDAGFDGIIALQGSDIRFEANQATGNRAHGLHLGEGVRDALVVGNTSTGNQVSGLFFCFDVLRAEVVANRFEANADSGISGLGWGGRFGDRHNLIASNTLRANGRWGLVAVESIDNTIRDNLVEDNSRNEPGRYSGLTLFTSRFTTVIGNRVGSTQDTPSQRLGIEEMSGSDLNLILNNDCRGNLEAGIRRAGPRTKLAGNLGEVLDAAS